MNTSQFVNTPLERQGLRVGEFALTLGCGKTTVYKMIREGRLRVVKLGSRTVIPRSEIERLLHPTGSDVA